MPITSRSSNNLALRYILESVYGTTPASGNPNNLRNTGESLAFAIQTDSSKEIRSDRQVTDLIQVGASSSGGINFEMSYKEFDTLFEAGFMGTWGVYGTNGVGTTFSATIDSAAGTIVAAVAPTGSSAFTTLAVGQFFRLSAGADAANGAILRVASVNSTTITVSTATPIPGSGSRPGIAGSFISTSRLSNGTTMRSFSVEKGLLDPGQSVNGQFFRYRGMNLAKISLALQSGSFVTGSFEFLGKDSVRSTVTGLPGTPVASAAYDVVNAVTGVGRILENGAALADTFIKSLKLDLDNKLRGQDAIGVLGNAAVAPGTLAVSGEMEVYLADGSMYDKFVNNTASSIIWTMADAAGNGYAVTLPKVKYADAKVQAGGLDQDVMLTMPFTALMDSTTSKTILIDRFGVAV